MKTFLMSLVLAFTALVLIPSSFEAAPKTAGTTLADMEVNGQKAGTVRLADNGLTSLNKLASGHKVAVEMKNGQAVSARALTGRGISVPTTVQNETHLNEDPCAGGQLTKKASAARRSIIIVIRDGGTVIVIVIRPRLA